MKRALLQFKGINLFFVIVETFVKVESKRGKVSCVAKDVKIVLK